MNDQDVIINGVKYVPFDNNRVSVTTVKRVLQSQKYLSASAINNIVGALRTEPKTVKPKTLKKGKGYSNKLGNPFTYNTAHKTLFNISSIGSNGAVSYKKRKSPSKWNIQQAIIIQNGMNNNSTKGMTFKDVIELEKELSLSKNMIRKIMYNIEYGDLTKWIDDWKMKHLQTSPKRKPIQNNPQKRRDAFEIYR